MFTGGGAARPQRKIHRDLRGRRLVLVDIENVVRGPVMDVTHAAAGFAALEEVVPPRAGDHVIVASNPGSIIWAGLARPSAARRMGHGPDGADLALLEVLTDERVAERFDEVVVVSGDHIFTDVVAELGGLGVAVTVVAHVNGCSRTLRMAAGQTVYFNDVSNVIPLEAA